MRFKSQRNESRMPELNLVPMMDVIMTILIFFIIVSMTLTSQQAVNVTLPNSSAGGEAANTPDPLVVGLNQQRQLILDDQNATEAQLIQRMRAYLAQNSKGSVILKADRRLSYQEVIRVLGVMRDVGGDRVSLAIES
jgi:biopolymer transport protein ExbD